MAQVVKCQTSCTRGQEFESLSKRLKALPLEFIVYSKRPYSNDVALALVVGDYFEYVPCRSKHVIEGACESFFKVHGVW